MLIHIRKKKVNKDILCVRFLLLFSFHSPPMDSHMPDAGVPSLSWVGGSPSFLSVRCPPFSFTNQAHGKPPSPPFLGARAAPMGRSSLTSGGPQSAAPGRSRRAPLLALCGDVGSRATSAGERPAPARPHPTTRTAHASATKPNPFSAYPQAWWCRPCRRRPACCPAAGCARRRSPVMGPPKWEWE